MYTTNTSRTAELLAGLNNGQNLPELQLAIPGVLCSNDDNPPQPANDLGLDLFGFMADIGRNDALYWRGRTA